MAIRDALAALFSSRASTEQVQWLGPSLRQMVLGLTAEELYRTQPHLRIVLDFVARNVAHLGLPSFERIEDNDRRRLIDDPLAQLFARPNPSMTRYELIETLVLDLGLYDIAYWLVAEVPDSPSGWRLQPIPPSWVLGHAGGTAFAPGSYKVRMPNGTTEEIASEDMLVFHGWNPGRPKQGTSPVETLKQILAEQIQAWSYREQVWQRGGRAGAVITRPAGADWSDAARERFVTDWKARWTGATGAKAGGTPILEDGMTINNLGFSAREDEWAEVAKVALSTVAAVYHVNPVMVGILDNANFSNTKEFRKMLYSETLGPLLAMIEDRINTFLVPRVTKAKGAYVEFNIQEKMQGDFEEQAAVFSSAVGRPWMVADEARAKFNMPALGGDAELLVTPLNVLVGGQASPRDGQTAGGGGNAVITTDAATIASVATNTGLTTDDIVARVNAATALIRAGFDPTESLVSVGLDPIRHLGLLPVTIQKPIEPEGTVDEELVDAISTGAPKRGAKDAGARRVKAEPGPEDAAQVEEVMLGFFKRQRSVVLARLGAKAPLWWDEKRWNDELAADLLDLSLGLTASAARAMLARAGIDPDQYDVERTKAFLKAVAESRAALINQATLQQVEAIVDGVGPADADSPAHAFDVADSTRAGTIGATLATTYATFATVEAGRQTSAASKTWLVMSGRPRPEHAQMDGETVGIDDTFSNGAKWPGDPVLGADGVAGCTCEVEIVYG